MWINCCLGDYRLIVTSRAFALINPSGERRHKKDALSIILLHETTQNNVNMA